MTNVVFASLILTSTMFGGTAHAQIPAKVIALGP